jgi:uncharacterized NAD(P)/FAD-binding protein YdhS
MARQRVIVIGGGASGALLSCHLLRNPTADIDITLIEKSAQIGRGIAYGTSNPNHLLNVRAGNMSAFPDDPEHFVRWLVANGTIRPTPAPFSFVPRTVYGHYLAGLIESLQSAAVGLGRLDVVRAECLDLRESPSGVSAGLADGTYRAGDIAILAVGHDLDRCSAPPSSAAASEGIARDASVLILGTGLTMVDHVLSLLDAGHEGTITAASRHGLLPRVHKPVAPLEIEHGEIPFGVGAADLLRWMRALVAHAEMSGGDWRSAIDGIRPFAQALWRDLSPKAKRSFLQHARAWWHVHRHRMAPEVHARISAAIAAKRLVIIAGSVCGTFACGKQTEVLLRRRHDARIESVRVSKVIQCKGIVTNPLETTNPVLRNLFDQRLARADPLRIGLDVTESCALIGQSGRASQRLYAVGPLTRAAFWEIVAIPDIRQQCAKLATLITERSMTARATARKSSHWLGFGIDSRRRIRGHMGAARLR